MNNFIQNSKTTKAPDIFCSIHRISEHICCSWVVGTCLVAGMNKTVAVDLRQSNMVAIIIALLRLRVQRLRGLIVLRGLLNPEF